MKISFEFYYYDLQKYPVYHAWLEMADGTKKRIGCIHYLYGVDLTPRRFGYVFVTGMPELGIPYTQNIPQCRETPEEAARDLAEFVGNALRNKNV